MVIVMAMVQWVAVAGGPGSHARQKFDGHKSCLDLFLFQIFVLLR